MGRVLERGGYYALPLQAFQASVELLLVQAQNLGHTFSLLGTFFGEKKVNLGINLCESKFHKRPKHQFLTQLISSSWRDFLYHASSDRLSRLGFSNSRSTKKGVCMLALSRYAVGLG
jgi:hypothetical protein